MINYEIKSQLAKLLATEDLVVENKSVETASFDVETRVLTLPLWERASEVVYDMLVGHEVGHALFTPNEWDFIGKIPRAFVNVTEDARIEKLMKRKYPGLSKTFYRGYHELSESDFFDLADQDISEFTLPDRVNLHFKIGNFVDIPFNDEELEIVNLIGKSETFEEAVSAAEEMYKYCQSQQPEQKPQQDQENQTEGSGEQQKTNQSESFDMDSDDSEGDDFVESEEQTESESDPFEVSTDQTFEDGMQELTNPTGRSTEYYEVPVVKPEKVVVPNSEIHTLLNLWMSEYTNETDNADDNYNEFKRSAKREVNYLVKEFECKKSADAYSRTTTSRTGVLDCTKLHTYKYNEDLFKKVNVIPDGKNHGLIFILDWSGSMADCMQDTIKQLYNLIWFCSKVNIPFDVYAFTNSWYRGETRPGRAETRNEKELNKLAIDGDFSLMNLLTSKVNKKTLEQQMKMLYRVVYYFLHYVSYTIPSQINLSGTPLNETLVCLHQIIPQFKKENGLQKVHTIILTDGEAHPLNYFGRYTDYFSGKDDITQKQISAKGYLRNRKTGHTYEIGYAYWSFTDCLLKDLKQAFPEVNLIGIRITASRDFSHFIKRYGFLSEQDLKKARKEKSYTIKDSGYDAYFAMMQSALSSNTEFSVEEDASKARIKSAFMKSLKAKTLNKKVLSQFMDLVC